jgi:hypothetical protein
MKLKTQLKTVAAAVALGLSAAANAALDSPGGGNGSLFLSVWSAANPALTYTRDLGVNVNDFLPNSFPATASSSENPVTNVTPETGFSFTSSGDTLFTTTFGGVSGSDIRWTITGGDNTVSTTVGALAGVRRVLLTGDFGTLGPSVPTMTNGQLASSNTVQQNWISALNPLSCEVNLSCIGPSSGAGNNADPAWAGQAPFDIVADSLTEQLSFFAFRGPNSTTPGAPATTFTYENSGFRAFWSLNTDGTATYTLAAVPAPSAWLLMMAGLAGLGAIARRRNAR